VDDLVTGVRRVLFRSLSYIGRSERKMEAQFVSMQLHIGYIRSLEDTERVRTACVKYLQHCLPSFYPERLDIVKQLEQLAATLGGDRKSVVDGQRGALG